MNHQIYHYNICNGLSNQLLYHAASIATAIQEQYSVVYIPDYFIVDGIQRTDLDVLPSFNNSLPFSYVFDSEYFLTRIESISTEYHLQKLKLTTTSGASAQQQRKEEERQHVVTKAKFVKNEGAENRNGYKNDNNNKLNIQIRNRKNDDGNTFPSLPDKCAGMNTVMKADPHLMNDILKIFQPSENLLHIISDIKSHINVNDVNRGVCIHHRDGDDWHEHCQRWSHIRDGVYRGNCLTSPSYDNLLDSFLVRGVTNQSWVYYCGDHSPPPELSDIVRVYTKEKLLLSSIRLHQNPRLYNSRDISALIDFFVCQDIPTFIGNSVSTFSALQIAIRNSNNTFWYNSQSIPLADFWKVFHMPIVYTYTELSKESGKYLLIASITSVRRYMPHNHIHILYNGNKDKQFMSTLLALGATLHDHRDPIWKDKIEQMRLNGNKGSSNLFLHSGNYFGTWQRIDIPLYLKTEYCLLLDSDTIVKKAFSISDFGLNLTRSIAMSAEVDMNDERPWNAGVTLMNLPFLRKTYNDFLEYVYKHVDTATFDHPAPSDQGAYLSFYKDTVQFLPISFNYKPYWNTNDKTYNDSYIIHYHGAKPHDYLRKLMGYECDEAIEFLCKDMKSMKYLCPTISEFAQSVDILEYCSASFPTSLEDGLFCANSLDTLLHTTDSNSCHIFGYDERNQAQNVPNQNEQEKTKNKEDHHTNTNDRVMFGLVSKHQEEKMIRKFNRISNRYITKIQSTLHHDSSSSDNNEMNTTLSFGPTIYILYVAFIFLVALCFKSFDPYKLVRSYSKWGKNKNRRDQRRKRIGGKLV